MLELNQTIEGLAVWDDHELKDDTPTNTMLVHFDVVAEEMPYLTENGENGQPPTGRVVYKTFIHIFKEKHLGNFQFDRRINDAVHWDEGQGKWIVDRLHKSQSDIRQYVNEWNAFSRNSKEGGDVGVPLSLLFRNDPSRVSHYARFKINTIERLANLPAMDADTLGMGCGDDIKRAQNYLQRAKENAPTIMMQAQSAEIENMRRSMSEQQATILDLTSKLREMLEGGSVQSTLKTRKKRGPNKKQKKLPGDEQIEGIE